MTRPARKTPSPAPEEAESLPESSAGRGDAGNPGAVWAGRADCVLMRRMVYCMAYGKGKQAEKKAGGVPVREAYGMEKIAILTDSCSELSEEMKRTGPVCVVPLTVQVGGRSYRDGEEITGADVLRLLAKELPKTSLPGGDVVDERFDTLANAGYTHVLCLMLSGGISGTANMMRMRARDETRMVVKVFDSGMASIGTGSVAMELARYVREGASWENVLVRANELLYRTHVFFSVDTLEYLKKGGRIGRITAMAGTALQIKPILTFHEGGVLCSLSKVRGRSAVVEKLVSLCREEAAGSRRYNVLMAWDGQSEQGDELRGALHKALPHCERLYEVNFGAVLTTYVGPGALGAGIQVLDGLPDDKKKGFPWGNR